MKQALVELGVVQCKRTAILSGLTIHRARASHIRKGVQGHSTGGSRESIGLVIFEI